MLGFENKYALGKDIYDIGENNENTVRALDTSEFVTMDIFDYNVLFNTLSASVSGSIDSSRHSETWTKLKTNDALKFIFKDWDGDGVISRPKNLSNHNDQYADIVPGVLNTVPSNLLDLLFNKDTPVIGKNYVGPANYLFQYMDDPNDDYYGYYYYDSDKNAASYNASDERFYVYD